MDTSSLLLILLIMAYHAAIVNHVYENVTTVLFSKRKGILTAEEAIRCNRVNLSLARMMKHYILLSLVCIFVVMQTVLLEPELKKYNLEFLFLSWPVMALGLAWYHHFRINPEIKKRLAFN